MEDMKRNIADAEKAIAQASVGFKQYVDRESHAKSEAALDSELKARYDAYVAGLAPMLKYAKNGMFEAIIEHENETARINMIHAAPPAASPKWKI